MLAGLEGMRYKEEKISLAKGDRLFLYTDGVTEANNPAGELFGDDRLLESLNKNAMLPLDQLLSGVKASMDTFASGAEQFDDITMMVLEVR